MLIKPYKPGSLQIECDVPRCFALLSALPTRKKWIDRTMVFAPTGAAIEFIQTHWPEAVWVDEADDELTRWQTVKMLEQNTKENKLVELEDPEHYAYKTQPFAHQHQGFLLGREHKAFAYFHEQGCGKTKVVLDNFAYLWEKNEVDVLIVIAPNGVHSNWLINEVPAHLPDRIPAQCYTYSASMRPKALSELTQIAGAASSTARPCIIAAFNVEGFVSRKAQHILDAFLANHRCMMVVDESNSIQNPSAERTKYIVKAGRKSRYRRIACGTPITRGVENLFSQFKFLDPMILGHENYYTFRAQYCIMGGFEQRQIVGYRHIKELADIVDGHSHRVLKKDCLDLPDKLYKKHFFEMTPAQVVAYDTVRKSALEDLEEVFGTEHGRELAKEIAITRLIRLQQITCGWVPFSADQAPVALAGPNPRLQALLTLLEDAEGKGIIWVTASSSRADISLIASHLSRGKLGGFVEYHGGIPDKEREYAIEQFQNNPAVRWFLASKAAAVGLTLTAACQSFYYNNNFDLRIRLQSEDRNHRIGSEQHDKILYTDIYTTGIDKKIVTSLRNKKSLADLITKDPKSIFME